MSCLALLCGILIGAQDPAPSPPKEEDIAPKVDAAVERAVAFVVGRTKDELDPKKAELVLLTLACAGFRRDDPFFSDNMNKVFHRPVSGVYNAGLLGLLMEKLDRRKYQMALGELAIFLVDNQAQNGQWPYAGRPRKIPATYSPSSVSKKKDEEEIPPGRPVRIVSSGQPAAVGSGDNSNTQFAMLGLFAAMRANVQVPKETLERTEAWLERSQNPDGGWGYSSGTAGGPSLIVANGSSGSMTAAGMTGLVVCKFFLGKDWKPDPRVQRGLGWLGRNVTASVNPGGPAKGQAVWQYYWLYGLGRVGVICGESRLGGKDWYREGADWLLKNQKEDGRWETAEPDGMFSDTVVDTCFAVLFLRRAAPELWKPKDYGAGDAPPKPEEKKNP